MRQAEAFGQRRQELALRGRLGELAAKGLARIGERVVDQVLLLAAVGQQDLDLVAALDRKRFRQELPLLERMRHHDEPRARLVVVELAEERAQHLARTDRTVGPGEVGPVAPILAGPEEEDLDAAEAAFLMDREDVGLLDVARVDALMRLHRRQRGEAVAIDRGAFEVERARRLLHFDGQLLLHGPAAARQEGIGLAHQLGIFGVVDLARAGARAALDLKQETRPGPALEEAVGAGAQQEGALQRRDGAVDRPDRSEWTVIMPGTAVRPAVLEDLRRPVIGGDQDIGKRLVVAEQHIEARPQPLDQVGLEQQRLGFGRGRHEFERRGGRDHAFDARVIGGRPGIGEDALFYVLRLADIKDLAAGVGHAVDARRIGRELGIVRHRRPSGRKRTGAGGEIDLGRGLEVGEALLLVLLGEIGRGIDVFLRAVHGLKRKVSRAAEPAPRQRGSCKAAAVECCDSDACFTRVPGAVRSPSPRARGEGWDGGAFRRV